VKGVDRAVLIRTSMGASRRSVKKRRVLSQSLVQVVMAESPPAFPSSQLLGPAAPW
jgi:hypothetical protein